MSNIILGLMRIDQMSKEDVKALIENALELGIKEFDLADIYGIGKCESLVGEVLKENPSLREKMIIQSKVGIIPRRGYDLSFDYIISAVKASLSRLNIDYLDNLLIHRVDLFMDASEVARAVDYLFDHKMIKRFGVSNFSSIEIEYLNSELNHKIFCDQVQLGLGNTTMLDQAMFTNLPPTKASKENDNLFFYLKKEKLEIQCWSPFQYGFIEGSIFNEDKFPILNNKLKELAEKYNTTKCGIATAFLTNLTPQIKVICGSTNINHIKECLDGEKIKLDKLDWYDLYKSTGVILP